MEGGDLLQRLVRGGIPGGRRIVLMSAFDTPQLRARAHRQGAHLLVPKPLLPHTLRRLFDLDHPLPTEATPAGTPEPHAPTADPATLMGELETLLGEADSHAVTLWERHGSAFIELLPACRAKALAGAMQRLDFDEAQAALRGESTS